MGKGNKAWNLRKELVDRLMLQFINRVLSGGVPMTNEEKAAYGIFNDTICDETDLEVIQVLTEIINED